MRADVTDAMARAHLANGSDERPRSRSNSTHQYLEFLERRLSIRSTSLARVHSTKEFISHHVMLLPFSSDGTVVDGLVGLAIYEAAGLSPS
jgi:hypothetical protein